MAGPALMVAGTALSIWGQVKGAQDQANAARKDADSKAQMAQEVLDRQAMNKDTMTRQGDVFVGNQVSQYAAAGVDVGSGSPLLAMENTLAETRRKINNSQREADFRAKNYIISSASERDAADQAEQAAYYRIAGTLLTTGSAAAENWSGGNKKDPTTTTTPGTTGSGNISLVGEDMGSGYAGAAGSMSA